MNIPIARSYSENSIEDSYRFLEDLSQDYEQKLDNLCMSVYRKDFLQAEELTLELVRSILNHNDTQEEDILITNTIYASFNDYYKLWLKRQDKDLNSMIKETYSDKHDNYLIAHCSDPAAIDDLLY